MGRSIPRFSNHTVPALPSTANQSAADSNPPFSRLGIRHFLSKLPGSALSRSHAPAWERISGRYGVLSGEAPPGHVLPLPFLREREFPQAASKDVEPRYGTRERPSGVPTQECGNESQERGNESEKGLPKALIATIICTLFIPFLLSQARAQNPTATAQDLFLQKKYTEAVRTLKSVVPDSAKSPSERLEAAIALASFYANDVGDIPRTITHYRRALRLSAPDPETVDGLKNQARKELDRWLDMEKKYRQLNASILQMKAKTFERRQSGDNSALKELEENRKKLDRIIAENPTYYRIHEVHYALGLTHLALENRWRAWRAFAKALSLKPAMHLAQPVDAMLENARKQWLRGAGRNTAWTLSGLMIACVAFAWFRSRLWTWFRFRHLAVGLAVIVAWIALFHLCLHWTGNPGDAGKLVNSDGVYPKPVYIHTALGEPGSDVVQALFYHGLIAVCGTFLFCSASGRMRRRARTMLLNTVFAILLAGSLATLYYFDHCDQDGRFYPEETYLPGMPQGYLAYPMNDPEPYLLINPLYYKGLDLSSIDDPVLVEWLESYAILHRNDP